MIRAIVMSLAMVLASSPVLAHGGGTDANGCHMERATGIRHCHGGGPPRARPAPAARPLQMLGNPRATQSTFASCAEARAAGAAPVRSGDPGYSRKLDRDGDGIGCE